MNKSRAWLYVVALAALMVSACTSSSSGDEPLAPITVSSSTTTATSTTTTETTVAAAAVDAETAAVIETWQEFITIGAARSDPGRIAELSDDETTAAAERKFFDPRGVQTFYTQVTIDGTTATIEDCALFDKPLSTFLYIPMEGTAELADNGQWELTGLEVNNTFKCIPGDLATEVLAAYENYWDAEVIYRNPPDPEHPLLEEINTGRQLETQLDAIARQNERGIGWRGRPSTHPEFFDYDLGVFVIDDCQLTDPESGQYDLETGERTEYFPEITPGQRDGIRTRLEPVDEKWKVEFVGGDRDIDCDFAPTEVGIPIVGPYEES